MKNWPEPFNLIVCGVGGQGNILISRLIGRTLTAQGYTVSIGETFGAAQRGGSVFSSLRISKKRLYGPLIPEGQANIILSLEPMEALRQMKYFGNSEVRVLSNTKIVQPADVLAGKVKSPEFDELETAIAKLSGKAWFVPATDIALDLGSAIVTNIIMLGALVGSETMPISLEQAKDEVRATVPDPKIKLNLEALNRGYNAILKTG